MGNPFLRPLFKPILDKAARQAYKMAGTTREFAKDAYSASQRAGERIYKSPGLKNYMDAAAGRKGRGWQATALGLPTVGAPYAYNKLAGMFPERAKTLDETEKKEIVEEKETEKKDDDLLTFENEQKEQTDENIEVHEDVGSTMEGANDQQTNDQALVTQTNLFGQGVDNDSIERINGYKDVIRQIMGSGDAGSNMQATALLLQVGSALMSGKTTESGLAGFFDVVGKAGMQMAPTLFQMGMEKGKAEREIGAAALNMYMSELDKMNNRSGPFTVVYENIYDTDASGAMKFSSDGNPLVKDRRRVQTFYRKSPEIQQFMDINSGLGYDRFTFVDTTASDRGIGVASGAGGEGVAPFESKAARDAHRKYAQYLKRGLDTMSDFIMPLLIEQKDSLTGVGGEIGRIVGPKKALIEGISNALFNSAGGQKEFERKFADIQTGLMESMTVPESATYAIDVGGSKIGVFLDSGNKYGMNEGARYENNVLVDPGTPAEIITWDGMKMMLDNPNRQAMIAFENTLGLMIARDRQPTGRMLADVLRRSFEDAKMTGFGRAQQTSSVQVLNNYVEQFKRLSNNMNMALKSAYVTDDPDKGEPWIYDPDSFQILGIDKFRNSWYGLRQSDPTNQYQGEVGDVAYGAWFQSLGGNIQMDTSENNASSSEIYNNANQILSQ